MRPVALIFCLLGFGFFGELSAQQFLYRHYTTDDGLPHNVGYDILQDAKGFIWIGTDNGLLRFDGETFKVYNENDSLNSPYIITLNHGPDSSIWIGGHRSQINILHNHQIRTLKRDHLVHYDPIIQFLPNGNLLMNDILSGLNSRIITEYQIVGDELHPTFFVWKPGEEAQLDQITDLKGANPLSRRPKLYLESDHEEYVRLFHRKSGEFVFTSSQGLFEYIENGKIRPLLKERIGNPYLSSITEDSEGRLYLGGKGKIWRIDQQEIRVFENPFDSAPIKEIEVNSKGNVFCLTASGALYNLDTKSEQIVNLENTIGPDVEPSMIFSDLEDNLWCTTNGQGIFCIYSHNFDRVFVNVKNENNGQIVQLNPFVNCVAKSLDGKMLIGTQKGLIQYLPKISRRIKLDVEYAKEAGSNNMNPEINQFLFLEEGLFVELAAPEAKYRSGLYLLSNDLNNSTFCGELNKTLLLPGERLVTTFRVEVKIWSGCHQIDRIIKNTELTYERWLSIYQASEREYYIGTNRKFIFLPNGFSGSGEVIEGLTSDVVNQIIPQGPKLLLATEAGLAICDTMTKRVEMIPHDPNIGSAQFRQMVQDHLGRYWLASPRGLHMYDGQEFYSYYQKDGLVANDINYLYLNSDNKLWICTSVGISTLDLNQPVPKSPAPNLYIESLLVDGEAVSQYKPIRIGQFQTFQMEYAAIGFLNPRQISFRYRLSPQHPWESTKYRNLSFQRLEPGSYQIEIQARKPNSPWGTIERLPELQVLSFWWQRTSIQVLGVILFLLLTGAITTMRVRNIRKREAERSLMEQRFAQLELQTLQAQMNPHFIFNSLNAIQHFIHQKESRSASAYLSRFAKLIRLFLDASKAKYHPLSEEIEMLGLYLDMEKLCYEDKFEYEIQVDPDLHPAEVDIPTMLIQPFVENAVIHGLLPKDGTGMLSLQFEKVKDILICHIIDDGIGREKARELREKSGKKHTSRGLQITEERLRVMNYVEGTENRIEVIDRISKEGLVEGTEVKVYIPIEF